MKEIAVPLAGPLSFRLIILQQINFQQSCTTLSVFFLTFIILPTLSDLPSLSLSRMSVNLHAFNKTPTSPFPIRAWRVKFPPNRSLQRLPVEDFNTKKSRRKKTPPNRGFQKLSVEDFNLTKSWRNKTPPNRSFQRLCRFRPLQSICTDI